MLDVRIPIFHQELDQRVNSFSAAISFHVGLGEGDTYFSEIPIADLLQLFSFDRKGGRDGMEFLRSQERAEELCVLFLLFSLSLMGRRG